MSKTFCAMLIAPVFLFASVQSAASMDGAEIVAKLDASAPRFQSDDCKAARNTMANYGGHVGERILEGAFFGVLLGPFGLPMAFGVDMREARIANMLVEELQNACGRKALFPVYLEAANKGDAGAEAWIGQCYQTGDGAERDPAQAIAWYQKSIDQGFAPAMVNLGDMYVAGDGVTVDDARAVALWQNAAKNGSVPAKAKLGEAYYDGHGVAQDYSKALALWQEAVRKYDPTAQADVGRASLEGKAVAQNFLVAQQNFRAAAWNGSGLAQFELGFMYETGTGLLRSDLDAYRWYAVADLNGYAQARSKRQELAAKLAPDVVQAQDAAATACVKSQFTNCP